MKRLLTYESFVPKNIEKREKELELKNAKELADYNTFLINFKDNFEAIKDKKSNDPMEQSFIDLIKDCEIKLDQKVYSFQIFLMKDNKYMCEYDWKYDKFLYSYDNIWSVFESRFNISRQDYLQFIKNRVEAHFKLKTSTIHDAFEYNPSKVEKYFNNQ